jgi:hypothetical protein
MQQCRRRFARHPEIAIGHASNDVFLQPQNTFHTGNTVKRRNKMHFTGTRVGKTRIHPAIHQRMNQTFRTIHAAPPFLISKG